MNTKAILLYVTPRVTLAAHPAPTCMPELPEQSPAVIMRMPPEMQSALSVVLPAKKNGAPKRPVVLLAELAIYWKEMPVQQKLVILKSMPLSEEESWTPMLSICFMSSAVRFFPLPSQHAVLKVESVVDLPLPMVAQ
jgi:hypothetical protein